MATTHTLVTPSGAVQLNVPGVENNCPWVSPVPSVMVIPALIDTPDSNMIGI
jgi:hypothetical protein